MLGSKIMHSNSSASIPDMDTYSTQQASRLRILKAVRALGILIALLIVADVTTQRLDPSAPEWFFQMRSLFDLVVAAFLLCPFARLAKMGSKCWWGAFLLLCLMAVGFAFLRVIGVLFDSMAAFEAGEKLAVPGWSGMLIFAVFSQLPTVFFQRFPRQLG
jgi:hypothetical protein